MREVAIHVQAAWASRLFRGFLLLLALAGCALTWLPLLGLPGFELSLGLAILHGLFGGIAGIACMRCSLGSASKPDFPRVVPAFIAASLSLWLTLLPALALATLRTALLTPCNPFATSDFFALLAPCSSAVAAAAGVCVASFTKRRWSALSLLAALLAASAVHTLWPIFFGPQVFAFNHFAGYWPGPLYDENLRVPAALFWFRLGSLALVGLFLAAASAARRATGACAHRLALVGAVCAVAFLALESSGTSLGFRMTDDFLSKRLGGMWTGAQLEIHYPSDFSPAQVQRLVDDVRFRHHQVSQFLGAVPPGQVRVWVYRSAREKQALVGAERTQFSKPWRREVHINDMGAHHPVLKHELVHAMAGPYGSPPFAVTATLLGLSVNMALVEGLAEAAANPVDELTLHQWAAAMKKLGLLPDVRKLLQPGGFYGAASSRAYSTVGSFVRWLTEARGEERLRALYRHGDFEGVYGRALDALATEFEGFLDRIELEEQALNQAQVRFRRGSIFERRCVREVARLSAQATAVSQSNPEQSLALWQRCHEVQPEDSSHEVAQARELVRLGRTDEARQAIDELLKREGHTPGAWAEAALARVDLAIRGGDDATARQLLEALVKRKVSPAVERTSLVRLGAFSLPPQSRKAIERFFADADDGVRLSALREALASQPAQPLLAYLLGRRLTQTGDAESGQKWLAVALAGSLPESLAEEATRLAIQAAALLGHCEEAQIMARTTRYGPTFAAQQADWVERCHFLFEPT